MAEGDIQGEPNQEAAIQRRTVHKKPKNRCKTTIKVAIGIFAPIVCHVLVIRTLTLVIMPFLESAAKNHCSLNSTSPSNIKSMVYHSSSEYIRRLSVFMKIIITVLQWPAHGYFFYYLYKFFAQRDPEQQSEKCNWWSFFCRHCCKGALVILSLGVLTISSTLTIAGDIINLVTEQISLNCVYPPLRAHQIIYYITTFLTYILEVAERYVMVCFTAFIGAMWHDGYETRKNKMANAPPNSTGYVDEFNKIADCIKPIYKIFRSFFVFQWLVHVYLLFTQIVHLLYPWIKDGRNSFTSTTNSTPLSHGNYAAVICYISALLIIYICGLKMNSYRRRYIRKAKLTYSQLLEHDRENKSIFTPRVPGTGLSISLESPGYMLGVVITMFGLVGALLAM